MFGFSKLGGLLNIFAKEKSKSTSIVGTVVVILFMLAWLAFMAVMISIAVIMMRGGA